MAQPMSAAQFKAALEAEGLTVRTRSGWSTHNRNHMGSWGPLNGVMIHHTASGDGDGIVDLCYRGRSDLPGPLCHAVIHKDGTLTLTGWGRANHAGSGDDDALRAVIAESPDHPKPNENNTDGNARFVGFECVNRGDGRDPWPEKQRAAIARAAAAVCRHYGWGPHSVIGHLEWTNQKIDPRGFSMHDMRTWISRVLSARPGADVPIFRPNPEEDPVPETIGRTDDEKKTRKPGEWKALSIDGVDLVAGAQAYSATVYLALTAPAGSQLQGRFYHHRPDGTRWKGSLIERTATAGGSYVDFHHEGEVKKDERVRFELCFFPPAGATEDAVISRCRLRGLYWKA